MPDLSAKSGLVYCPNCGYSYNARKFASCPNCGGGKKGGFQPTEDPNAKKAGNGGFQPTADPNVTKPPKGEDWGGGDGPNNGFDPTKPFGEKGTPGKAVVGWLVAVSGPCRGQDYPLHVSYNYIGREEGDVIITGDMNISAHRDSTVAFDDDSNKFFISHVDGKNLLRVNGAPVLNTAELQNYDRITIGKTELVFLGLCGEHFSWGEKDG